MSCHLGQMPLDIRLPDGGARLEATPAASKYLSRWGCATIDFHSNNAFNWTECPIISGSKMIGPALEVNRFPDLGTRLATRRQICIHKCNTSELHTEVSDCRTPKWIRRGRREFRRRLSLFGELAPAKQWAKPCPQLAAARVSGQLEHHVAHKQQEAMHGQHSVSPLLRCVS